MVLKAHLDPSQPDQGQRRSERRELLLETSGVLEGGAAANVTVHNLSSTGLLLETALPLDEGEILALDLPEAGEISAQVVWVSGNWYGCEFPVEIGGDALAAAQLRASAPASGPFPALGAGGDALGYKLNKLRRERGLTLAQIADQLGVSKPTVWAWEKSKARPLPERLEAIAAALDVAIEELTDAGVPGDAKAVLDESRIRIATAYGTSPDRVRIMIEL
ncbi:MAG: helix-turn-helix domain-containing protein [Pseudomonadota bacterium]